MAKKSQNTILLVLFAYDHTISRYPRQEEIVNPVRLHLLRVHSTCDHVWRDESEVVDGGIVIIHHRDGALPFKCYFAQLTTQIKSH
jgi:hypothetical protein